MLALLENMDKSTLTAQLLDGVVLMLLGMATVFLFLIILIFATKLMSKLCSKAGGKEEPTKAKSPINSASTAAPVANDAALAAAIVAAYDKDQN